MPRSHHDWPFRHNGRQGRDTASPALPVADCPADINLAALHVSWNEGSVSCYGLLAADAIAVEVLGGARGHHGGPGQRRPRGPQCDS